MEEHGSNFSIDHLVEQAFPYLRVRTMLDILSETIVQQRSLDRVLSSPEFKNFDRKTIEEFYLEANQRFGSLRSPHVKEGYQNFWRLVWDAVALDKAISEGAEGFVDPNSSASISYKMQTEHDSLATRQVRRDSQQLLAQGQYKEFFDLIWDSEIKRNAAIEEQFAIPSTEYLAGVHIAYADSLIFLSSVVSNPSSTS